MKSEAVLVRKLAVAGIVSLLLLAGCGGGTTSTVSPTPTPNPAPTITTISPNSTAAGSAAFILTINGTNFVAASMVKFGGSVLATMFVNSKQLTAAVPPASVASTGTPAVTVTNPAPGGGTSKAINFTITNGVPTIQGLNLNCVPAGEQFVNSVNNQLLVFGLNFVASSVVRWNGSDRPTTLSNSGGGQLTAQISASDIAVAGTAAVTVFNPPPGGGSSNALTFTINSGAVDPQSIAVDPAGEFAYVASQGCDGVGYVSMYTINPTTGALATIGPPVPANDLNTDSVTVDPSGKFVYVTSSGNFFLCDYGSVFTYAINPTTGALTSTTGVITGWTNGNPGFFNSMAFDPSGKFAYTADGGAFFVGGSNSVSMYTVNSTTGALTFTGMIATGATPASVAIDPAGKFAYVPNFFSNDVSMYTIDATTGALASIGTGTIAAGAAPISVAVDPAGKFAYVANWTGNEIAGSVSMYTIDDTTGALTSIGSIAAGTSPYSIAVDPAGKFAYVTNSGSNSDGGVSLYTIDATTGVLTSIGTIATEQFPTSIAIHPSGKFAYVTNSGSNSVSMYSIDSATGTLTLIGTIGT